MRDKSFSNMSEDDWDSIYMVHLKGTFSMTKFDEKSTIFNHCVELVGT